MNLLNRLTIKNLRLNKKRTIVTIIGIILSVALITAVATMYASLIDSVIDFAIDEKGNFHVAFYNVDYEEVEDFRNNRSVEKVYLTRDVGYAKLENSKNEYKPYACVKEFTKEALDNLSVKLVDGRLPENENEVVIPTHLKTNGRLEFKIGDIISLDIGNRINAYGEKLNQLNSYDEGNSEKIIDIETKKYKVVGIIERPASNIENYEAPGYTFISYMEEENLTGKVDVYARYTSLGTKDYLKVTSNILGIDEKTYSKLHSGEIIKTEELDVINKEMEKAKYQISENEYLIMLETNPIKNGPIGGLGAVAIIVCLIIVFTSVFCIKNSFDISITEKIKQYGMLRSVGATKKQIKKNVFYEAMILGLVGIPLGILCGFLASYILIIVSNYFINGMLSEGLKLHFSFSWLAVLVAIILGVITIYLSALRSAKRAAKVSPIDSIRNSAEIKISAKKVKSPKWIRRRFGIGGDISFKNLKRNKRKYRTTVISIVVSVFVFVALSYFMDLAFKAIKRQFSISEYTLLLSIRVDNDTQIFDKILNTTKLENIEEASILRQKYIKIGDVKYNKEYRNLTSEITNYDDDNISIVAVGEKEYRKFIKKLGLRYEEIKDKGILIDDTLIGEYDEEKNKTNYKNMRRFDYKVGDIISNELDKEDEKLDLKVEIGFITKEKPLGLKYYSSAMLVVSDEFYDLQDLGNKFIEVYYKSNKTDELQDNIDEILSEYDYSINNQEENVRAMERMYTLIGIFLYGFIIVISLIGITNIFNTITTNMELRRQEFAMLKSVGMTSKEFSRMIRMESIFMGTKSLFFGIPIGIGLCLVIYYYLGKEAGIPFIFPTFSVVSSILAVFVLITCIMKYSMSKINKQNTIETIRNENI